MRAIFLAAIAAIALGGCASYGLPGGSDYGYPGNGGYGYPGGGYGYPDDYGQQYGNQVVGTVRGVDPRYGRIILVLDQGGYGSREVALHYDDRTPLYYRGQRHPVEGLERGDVIRADAVESRGQLVARQIEVVRNIRESGGYYPRY